MPPVSRPDAPHALVIAYCFPPHGAVGTLRTLRLVRQLAAEGWQTTVLTGAPESYPDGTSVDNDLLRRVPSSTRVVQAGAIRWLTRLTRTLQPLRHRRGAAASRTAQAPPAQRRWQPGLSEIIDHAFRIPDGDAGWFAPAVLRGLMATGRRRPDVIYSSAPPWTGHVVGCVLASLLRRPWIADFRDPWLRGPWRRDRPEFALRALGALESLTVRRADALLFTTRAIRNEVVYHYGAELAAKCRVIANGCDLDEFASIAAQPTGNVFTLAHVGSLYGGRNPVPLLKAIASLVRRGAIDRTRFRLRLIGAVTLAGVDVEGTCRRLGIENLVEVVPAISRRDSLIATMSASALLLMQPDHPLSIPAKTYEYLAAGKPILALTGDGETAALVRESGMGIVVPPADEEAIGKALLEHVQRRVARGRTAPPVLYDGGLRAVEMATFLRARSDAATRREPAQRQDTLAAASGRNRRS